jgi:hypothetical protein
MSPISAQESEFPAETLSIGHKTEEEVVTEVQEEEEVVAEALEVEEEVVKEEDKGF